MTSFKDYLRLRENGVAPVMDPSVNNANVAIISKAKSMVANNPNAPTAAVLNQAAMKSVTQGSVKPGAAIKALSPTAPGQSGQPGQIQKPMMMSKKMKKK